MRSIRQAHLQRSQFVFIMLDSSFQFIRRSARGFQFAVSSNGRLDM